MAARVRLRRIGKNPKRNPHFRIAVYHKADSRDSKSIEDIGFYSPKTGEVKLKKERYDYWVKNGAEVSETVKSLVKKCTREVKNATDANA